MLDPDRLSAPLGHVHPDRADPPAQATRLQRLCADVRSAATSSAEHREQRIAGVLAPYLGWPDLLADVSCPCSPDRYVRHLLDTGPDYTILALVWRPRQMSPVHGHRTWCAFGLHKGWMVESFFAPGPSGPVPQSCTHRPVGSVSHASADSNCIHRLANLGLETAISIHVYGAPYDQIAERVNRIWSE